MKTMLVGSCLIATFCCLALACSKQAPDELPHSDAGASRSLSPDGGPLVGTVSAAGPVNSPRAQQLAMDFAAQRWPQYHPRMATAQHLGTYWRVVVEFQEPNMGAHVIIDALNGSVLDAGTSNGEH